MVKAQTSLTVADSQTEVHTVALEEVVDEHFLNRYRALLDAEDAAFDELEHASEDGDRQQFMVAVSYTHLTLPTIYSV